MNTIIIQCPSCQGTGVYVGFAERNGAAVVCNQCKGTGHTTYHYNEFTGRKIREDIKRVYLSGYGYCLTTGVQDYQNIGTIDMDKEGVSYQEFLNGEKPKHIEKFGCPMKIDQSACHKVVGFVDGCRIRGLRLGEWITNCKVYGNHSACWKRFHGEE